MSREHGPYVLEIDYALMTRWSTGDVYARTIRTTRKFKSQGERASAASSIRRRGYFGASPVTRIEFVDAGHPLITT